MIFKQFFGALALLAAAAGSAHAQSKELSSTGVLLDRVAAVVNDGIVLRSDVETQMQTIGDRIQQQGQQLPPRNVLRQQVLERLVLQELQMQRAERLGIKIADEAVNQALTEVAQRNNIKFSELPAALEAQGLDYRDYRDEVRREMVMQTLRQRDVLARVYVSPREVEQCIAKRKASPNEDNEFNLSHILIAIPESADTELVSERVARAEGVYERARAGEDFAQLAIAYSD
ncbi:MAG TPA: SurA N-terminal domain-containing protein, partial [Steroidobacteraceae bacterium]